MAKKKKNARAKDSENILRNASAAHMAGRLAEAEKGYLKVLKKKPAWVEVLNALGSVYLAQSRFVTGTAGMP